ncbi:dihydrofolate reductase family protein [Pseudarthrobacter sp. R1]|uniref:dihydrofolate reductase family protein n=1 Tax=Pseudarthrobacter sp. R1 TaxID=2944934 RepID=UPI00210BC660|nr:dihydrofolate reductase family protein [Pseudarthrobacter sp. R1]MCQ6269349.1 dihydrofolate reductase family protein [Pseudarthrobacter sp. R1]
MAEAAGDAVETIRRIKSATDGDIVVWGSLTLAETFLAAGVVDSVRLVVMPIAIGAGRGVFPSGQDPNVLNLQSATVYDQGLVELYGIRATRVDRL